MNIGVVVVNYRTPSLLARFVHSIHSVHAVHLVVVDVDPIARHDPTDRARGGAVTTATYLPVDDNIGYARSCNLGFQLLTPCEYIGFFNADVELTESALDQLVGHLETDGNLALVGPRQRSSDGRLTAAGIVDHRGRDQHRGWRQSANNDRYTDIIDVAYLSGSAIVARTRILAELTACPTYRGLYPGAGPWLPTNLYYEDNWLSRHAVAHGYRVQYHGPTTITHEWHQSPGKTWAAEQLPAAREMFVEACAAHGINDGMGRA